MEVARVLEKKAGFTMDVVTQKRMDIAVAIIMFMEPRSAHGRTALVIHPALKERSNSLAEPASEIKTCDHYEQFPPIWRGMRSSITAFPTVLVRGWRLSVF